MSMFHSVIVNLVASLCSRCAWQADQQGCTGAPMRLNSKVFTAGRMPSPS